MFILVGPVGFGGLKTVNIKAKGRLRNLLCEQFGSHYNVCCGCQRPYTQEWQFRLWLVTARSVLRLSVPVFWPFLSHICLTFPSPLRRLILTFLLLFKASWDSAVPTLYQLRYIPELHPRLTCSCCLQQERSYAPFSRVFASTSGVPLQSSNV